MAAAGCNRKVGNQGVGSDGAVRYKGRAMAEPFKNLIDADLVRTASRHLRRVWPAFDRARFEPDLLAMLLDLAPSTVSVTGDRVVIRHLYTERRLTPLDVYLKSAPPERARLAVLDYGQVLRDWSAKAWGALLVPREEYDEALSVLQDFLDTAATKAPEPEEDLPSDEA